MTVDIRAVRLVQLTESEARQILMWATGPEGAGLHPTFEEASMATKMREVLASFEVGRTLTMEEVNLIRARRTTKGNP